MAAAAAEVQVVEAAAEDQTAEVAVVVVGEEREGLGVAVADAVVGVVAAGEVAAEAKVGVNYLWVTDQPGAIRAYELRASLAYCTLHCMLIAP